uniref:Uncharacterized protein n=1 Tax=Anguilla anguilla TaxID=7936 RepID=A0A0E9S913_ANGAN
MKMMMMVTARKRISQILAGQWVQGRPPCWSLRALQS